MNPPIDSTTGKNQTGNAAGPVKLIVEPSPLGGAGGGGGGKLATMVIVTGGSGGGGLAGVRADEGGDTGTPLEDEIVAIAELEGAIVAINVFMFEVVEEYGVVVVEIFAVVDGGEGLGAGGKLASASGIRQESPYNVVPGGHDLSTGVICQTSFNT